MILLMFVPLPTQGDGEGFASCFTATATCSVELNGVHKQGRSEIAGLAVLLHDRYGI